MSYFVLFYFLCFMFFCIQTKRWNISIYLLAVYSLSLYFATILSQSDTQYDKATFIPSILFCSLFLLYVLPFAKKTSSTISTFTSTKFIRRFCIVGYVLSSILIIGCILFSSKIEEAIAYGLVETRQAMYQDSEVFKSYTVSEHIGNSAVRWLGGLSYSLLIMFFYSLISIPRKIVLKIMLLIASLSSTYIGILNGGRTNLIYWILFFGFCLVLFWQKLSKQKLKFTLFTLSLPVILLLGFYFFYVTIGRADYNHDSNTSGFLLRYIGQPYLNFCDFIDNLNYHPYSFRRILPLTSTFFEGRFNLDAYRELIYNNSHMNIGIFYTLMGDIFVDLGLFGLIAYSVIYYYIARFVVRRETFGLSELLILGLVYEIPLHGLFYYSMYRMETSACIIILLFVANYLKTDLPKCKKQTFSLS